MWLEVVVFGTEKLLKDMVDKFHLKVLKELEVLHIVLIA